MRTTATWASVWTRRRTAAMDEVARGRASRPREERAPASKLLGEVAGRTSAAGNKGPGQAPSGEQGEAAAELGLQDAMRGKRARANQEEDRTGTRAGRRHRKAPGRGRRWVRGRPGGAGAGHHGQAQGRSISCRRRPREERQGRLHEGEEVPRQPTQTADKRDTQIKSSQEKKTARAVGG
jgi:hypothetical protein